MSRSVSVAALVVALLLAFGFPSTSAASGSQCTGSDPVCLASLPADGGWEQAIRLPDLAGRWSGDDITVASIDTGVTPSADFEGRLLARVDFTPDGDGI